jgi:hypothetical protein
VTCCRTVLSTSEKQSLAAQSPRKRGPVHSELVGEPVYEISNIFGWRKAWRRVLHERPDRKVAIANCIGKVPVLRELSSQADLVADESLAVHTRKFYIAGYSTIDGGSQ